MVWTGTTPRERAASQRGIGQRATVIVWHASTDCLPSWPSTPPTPAYSVCSSYIPSQASTPLTTPSARACSYPSSRATTPSSLVLSRLTASTGSSHFQSEIISISSISNTDAHIEAGFDEATKPAQLSNSTGSQLFGLGLSGVMMPGSHTRGSSLVARHKRSFDEFDDGEGRIERRSPLRSVRPTLGQSPTTYSQELQQSVTAQQPRPQQSRLRLLLLYQILHLQQMERCCCPTTLVVIDLMQSDSESHCSSPFSCSAVELSPLQLP
ncbi:hypothetical protein BC831DRAFT_258893 [Entophlyctis helioformis]|nr:hypothetical protein BC831DRAFT_258893 [Entophlyctis helioformis]